MPKIKLAIISPSRSAYSETFIQAHKLGLNADVSFYYNGALPRELEGYGALVDMSLTARIKRKLNKASDLSIDEQALTDSMQAQGIQVVLAEYGPTAVQVLNVCRSLSLPIIVHFHGYDASQHNIVEKYAEQYKEMFHYASGIVAVSEIMKRMLMEYGAPEKKILLTRYAPNDKFLGIDRSAWNGSKFLFIGRFVDKKAPYYLVLAFQKVLERYPEAILTMAGDGVLYSTVKNLATEFGLLKNIHLLGAVDHSRVIELMSTSSCYVQHSIRPDSGDMEGAPVAIIEAMAAALPVVSTRHAGIPDFIKEGENGYLVEEHDVAGMAEGMIHILEDTEKSFKMGLLSREQILKNGTMNLRMEELDEFIMKAIE